MCAQGTLIGMILFQKNWIHLWGKHENFIGTMVSKICGKKLGIEEGKIKIKIKNS